MRPDGYCDVGATLAVYNVYGHLQWHWDHGVYSLEQTSLLINDGGSFRVQAVQALPGEQVYGPREL